MSVDNDASHTATVVEASGRDRPGLLEALARALTESGLSIASAHIDCHGERAMDSFYVVDEGGDKLTDPARAAGLKTRLAKVLDADPATRPSRLSKARASQAR